MTRVHLGTDMKKVDLQGAYLHKKLILQLLIAKNHLNFQHEAMRTFQHYTFLRLKTDSNYNDFECLKVVTKMSIIGIYFSSAV